MRKSEIDALKAQVEREKADLFEPTVNVLIGLGEELKRLAADNDQLRQQVTSLLTTLTQDQCHCDPPGSGEEYCTGECLLRDEIARLQVELTHRVGWEERCLRAEAQLTAQQRVVEAARKAMKQFDHDVVHVLRAAPGDADNQPIGELRIALASLDSAPATAGGT